MDAKELSETVERCHLARANGWMEAYAERPSFGHPTRQMADWQTLVAAYLADHPADDADPVTEGWLRTVGFQQAGPCLEVSSPSEAIRIALWFTAPGVVEFWRLHGNKLDHQPSTRGHVRRLCSALGIVLQEGGDK